MELEGLRHNNFRNRLELCVVTQINVVRLLDGIWNNLPLCGSREGEPLRSARNSGWPSVSKRKVRASVAVSDRTSYSQSAKCSSKCLSRTELCTHKMMYFNIWMLYFLVMKPFSVSSTCIPPRTPVHSSLFVSAFFFAFSRRACWR